MRSLFSISESENLKISAVHGGSENGEAATLREYWPSLALQRTRLLLTQGLLDHGPTFSVCSLSQKWHVPFQGSVRHEQEKRGIKENRSSNAA